MPRPRRPGLDRSARGKYVEGELDCKDNHHDCDFRQPAEADETARGDYAGEEETE